MDYIIFSAFAVSFLAIFFSFLAIARVSKITRSVHGLDWEAVATLLGDVATVKRSITRLNARLNGMDNAVDPPQFDWKQQVQAAMLQPAPKTKVGG